MSFQDKSASAKDKPIKASKAKAGGFGMEKLSSYLKNAGLFYLQTYPASTAHFKTVMGRKAQRRIKKWEENSGRKTEIEAEEITKAIDALAEEMARLGLLNDEFYARGMVTSMRNRGLSSRAILTKLRQKGLSFEVIHKYLEEIDAQTEGDADLNAAVHFAQKKRLIPFVIGDDAKAFEKALAKLARAGFSYDIARKVLEMEDDEIASYA